MTKADTTAHGTIEPDAIPSKQIQVQKELNLADIHIDGGTQSRVKISKKVVSEYAEAIQAGTDFPPVVVFNDDADYWLADGFHRFHAHSKAGKTSIPALVQSGTARDAILYSLSANWTHGLRRTNADKRKAVQTLLDDSEWAGWSSREIAELCGVTHPFVASIRNPRVVTVTTQAAEKSDKAKNDSAAAPEKPIPAQAMPEPAPMSEQSDTREAVAISAEENERVSDRLAVAAMDASDEEKSQAKDTIESLRAQVNTLTAELSAVKTSRDTYMRETNELKKLCAAQRNQLDKLSVAA
jgi:ParB-like chromosome segregation protein Spo0J